MNMKKAMRPYKSDSSNDRGDSITRSRLAKLEQKYVIYLTQGYYFNSGCIRTVPELLSEPEARKSLQAAKDYMAQASDLVNKSFTPVMRPAEMKDGKLFFIELPKIAEPKIKEQTELF